MRSKRMTAAGAAAVTAASVLTLGAPPANAAGPCGAGYSRIDVYNIGDSFKVGSIELYYNSSNGKNCALTYGTDPGVAGWKQIIMYATDGSTVSVHDDGAYKYYAGPVYLEAKGKCLNLTGGIFSSRSYYRNVKKVHCG
ncbi:MULTISPECIES: spore-associated protein A [Thermomonosporaceae]|uniref:spore-associated protein A n=1 Tax=Thermomonosporaceae TaxID=2012 RepID=UPI00255AAE23|nr:MULTISPECIES: spore-associated protein A [Thermomonosporaceae]MDL4772527.1 spore-associated protein A [Actinomadura xylanilytica]